MVFSLDEDRAMESGGKRGGVSEAAQAGRDRGRKAPEKTPRQAAMIVKDDALHTRPRSGEI